MTLRQVFICLEAQNPIFPPPSPTLYMYTLNVYIVYLFTQGRGVGGGGGELNQREGRGATVQAGSKIPT
jgi:hypothetical protein